MTSPAKGQPKNAQNETLSNTTTIDPNELANSARFMDALVDFLNEASVCMAEVKRRTGQSPGCLSPVQMNSEEKKEKLKYILSTLFQKCEMEISKSKISSIQAEDDCSCPPDSTPTTPTKKTWAQARRAGTPRPGASPLKGTVATSDKISIPFSQSGPVASASYTPTQPVPCPTYSNPVSAAAARSGLRYNTMSENLRAPRSAASAPEYLNFRPPPNDPRMKMGNLVAERAQRPAARSGGPSSYIGVENYVNYLPLEDQNTQIKLGKIAAARRAPRSPTRDESDCFCPPRS